MRAVTRALLVTALVFGSGCAQKDWIDRTLVTVDVTGTWEGSGSGNFRFELEQQGSTVKGLLRYQGFTSSVGDVSGPIEGTVGGDVFRFRNERETLEGEMTVDGDEMHGLISTSFGRRPFSLRRVGSSSPSASPPR